MSYFTLEDFNEFWSNSTIILDTSVFGLIKQSNHQQAKIMMDLFLHLAEDIWIPAQVKKEVDEVLHNPRISSGAVGRLDKFHEKIEEQFNKMKEGFHTISQEMFTEGHKDLSDMLSQLDLNQLFYRFFYEFQNSKDINSLDCQEFMDLGVHNSFFAAIMKNIGQSLTDDELNAIKEEGNIRYNSNPPIPPGYKDKNKPENKKYGDLIVWKEILYKMNQDSGKYIFITGDKKKDWLEKDNLGNITGPCSELISEAERLCPNSKISIVYFLDYIYSSSDHFFRNHNELIEHIEQNVLIRNKITQYIEKNLFELIGEDIQIEAANYKGTADPDIVDYINIYDPYYNNEGANPYICYEIEVGYIFEYIIDTHDSFDDPKDPGETCSSSHATVKLTVKIPIEGGEGLYEPRHLIVGTDEWEFDIDEVSVSEIIAPFEDDEMDEEPDRGYDDSFEDYEVDYEYEYSLEDYEPDEDWS